MDMIASAQRPTSPVGSAKIILGLCRPAEHRLPLLLLLLTFSFLMRSGNLGDWNFEVDDQFFSLVGHRVLAGDIPYVDIFDRKGPALYLLFAALAVFGKSVIPYQLAATLCLALGGYGVARIGSLFAGKRGSSIAGCLYCAAMVALGGANAQTPVFYNPLMIACAWAVITRLEMLSRGSADIRLVAGFACAGVAIAFKLSAAIEAMYFGMAAVGIIACSSVPLTRKLAISAVLAIAGLLPMLSAAMWYWGAGHFADFWQALVSSNLSKLYPEAGVRLSQVRLFAGLLAPFMVCALCGTLSLYLRREFDEPAIFVSGWALAAIIAVLSYPTISVHYLLPLLAPLFVLAASMFDHKRIGMPSAIALAAAYLWFSGQIDFPARARSRAESAMLVSYVREKTPNHRLLVWGFPSYLYVLADAKPPSILAFPPHFFDASEAGVAGVSEAAELRRAIASHPEAVVVQRPLPANLVNGKTVAIMERYLEGCAKMKKFRMRDHFVEQTQIVYSDCTKRHS